jgi:uncharacterized protein
LETDMSHAFADIAFTPAVREAQARVGSRTQYARAFEAGDEVRNAEIGPDEAAFIQAQRSFYMATVSETGWPYVQHRGGAAGFLKVVGAKTLSFVDVPGNRQFISVGNVATNDRVAQGEGSVTGSVAAGGELRELTTVVPPEKKPMRVERAASSAQ